MSKKAILVVSFGSSYKETRKKTIDQIEIDISKSFPEYKIYNAYTSKVIIKILKNRDNICIDTVSEALEKIEKDGIEEVIIQPTLMLNGIEYDLMLKDINPYFKKFRSIFIGKPLLTTTQDSISVIDAILEYLPANDDEKEATILIGHGTKHYSNSIYAGLDYMFKNKGESNIYVITISDYPRVDDILDILKNKKYEKIKLIPFMIVAGDHAINDINSSKENSIRNILENEGFKVSCIMEGLGENKYIRQIFVNHTSSIV